MSIEILSEVKRFGVLEDAMTWAFARNQKRSLFLIARRQWMNCSVAAQPVDGLQLRPARETAMLYLDTLCVFTLKNRSEALA
jgi:hypothetical protein